MDKSASTFCNACEACRRAKSPTDGYHGVLRPLPIPEQPWQHITLDFVTGFPLDHGCNAVLVVVCRLTKMRHYIPCFWGEKGTSAEATAQLLIQHIFRLHGLFDSVVSDRGTQFNSEVWKELCRLLKIIVKMSTACHPETDGQSENANKEMLKYLRIYVNYLQDDWVRWLCLGEFAANNAVSATTKISPFFANYGYNPRMSFDPPSATSTALPTPSAAQRIQRDKGKALVERMREIWRFAGDQIGKAQAAMAYFKDLRRKFAPAYMVGDLVWLSSKNLTTQRPSKKLDHKQFGPFKVLRQVGDSSYELELPEGMNIHPVFHANLLRLHPPESLPGQTQEPPPPVVVDNQEEYEVDEVLDSRLWHGKLKYKVKWTGHPPDDTWYTAGNFDHCQELLDDFHLRYPHKPDADSARNWKRKTGTV